MSSLEIRVKFTFLNFTLISILDPFLQDRAQFSFFYTKWDFVLVRNSWSLEFQMSHHVSTHYNTLHYSKFQCSQWAYVPFLQSRIGIITKVGKIGLKRWRKFFGVFILSTMHWKSHGYRGRRTEGTAVSSYI